VTQPSGIAISSAFADYLEELRETVCFPRCASLRNQGRPDPHPGVRFSNV
jgi:hypothetical protein